MYIFWIDPKHCDPPHHVTHPHRAHTIALGIQRTGWAGPPLTGYFDSGRVTLLSGTHRHDAAVKLGLKLPVEVYSRDQVEAAFGDIPEWKRIVNPSSQVLRPFKDIDRSGPPVVGS